MVKLKTQKPGYTVTQLSAKTGMSKAAIRKAIDEHRVQAEKIKGSWWIVPSEQTTNTLKKWLQHGKTQSPTAIIEQQTNEINALKAQVAELTTQLQRAKDERDRAQAEMRQTELEYTHQIKTLAETTARQTAEAIRQAGKQISEAIRQNH